MSSNNFISNDVWVVVSLTLVVTDAVDEVAADVVNVVAVDDVATDEVTTDAIAVDKVAADLVDKVVVLVDEVAGDATFLAIDLCILLVFVLLMFGPDWIGQIVSEFAVTIGNEGDIPSNMFVDVEAPKIDHLQYCNFTF